MKQLIKTGANVDDGSGDYLQKGGKKINNNFDEIYHQLGDDESIHESGAWKTITTSTIIDFGRSFAINTSNGQVNITLPKGSPLDYNKTIKLRDVWKSWSRNPVTLYAGNGDTVKGSSKKILNIDLMDIELVYCIPGRWEFIENKRVDLISNSDLSTVASKSFIATEGQRTFLKVFGNDTYNRESVEVYYRGNLLYYGDSFNSKSEYGSLNNLGVLGDLNGSDITLNFDCQKDDTVIIVTYMDGIATYRTSYISKTVTIRDENAINQIPDGVLARNLNEFNLISLTDFDLPVHQKVNPIACEVFVNGILLTNESETVSPSGYCSIEGVFDRDQCESINGIWTFANLDYELNIEDGSVVSIKFAKPFSDRDVVTLKCFNNDIGTLLEWDGENGIRQKSEDIFIRSDMEVDRYIAEYTDYDNPTQDTFQKIEEPVTGKISTFNDVFDVMYPIGTIYENAHNPDNPARYMGFGMWKRYMEGRVLVSWSSDSSDSDFGLNNNQIFQNEPTHTSGGTGGERSFTLSNDNIPILNSEKLVLVKDNNGSVIIGACEFDPEDEGPDLRKYSERVLEVNDDIALPLEISIIQPYVTVHRWVRVG